MSSDATSDQSATDGYLQRAQLLAELGRYDEAAAELGYAIALDPANATALTMLARVHLAADRPDAALESADAAVVAAPSRIDPLVARGLALTDLRQFKEAARVADEILALGPDDAYAQRSGAAILAGARNGQAALNAAWRGVELAPEEPQAHLVLGLVAARLELFDLAERAYREALRLDPELAEARHDMGVIRLDQRRYAEALEHLAEAAAIAPGRVDAGRTISAGLRQLVVYGAGYSLLATVLVAFLAAGNGIISRLAAGLTALVGGLLVWRWAAGIPNLTGTILPGLLRSDRTLALAVYAVAAAPALLLLYALVGTPWPLVLAITVAAVAELAVLARPVAR
ncbi:tetratricopeptide repeat protein [Micromonospora echinofusca]|uniref:Tetratricopeptide repeat protein n=1 Tax=Micromonospora echinofusca TaxID=47858 RepID=A0ABS3VWB0_MICEH|nr:tetratricopeptide repeat protein [Micromonospora echinofusca]MBO4208827.1 tetratricopeptide repeat protein [Micromonospora echinofusca]